MKQCPSCLTIYNDFATLCPKCRIPPIYNAIDATHMKTIYDQMYQMIGHKFDRVFMPDDNFYGLWDQSDGRLNQMANIIIKWLELDPMLVKVKYDRDIKTAGLYSCKDNDRTILVSSKHNNEPFYVAAILAHECMHYYMEMKHIGSQDVMTTELATDFGTIVSGLGILTVNGMYYKNYWHRTLLYMMVGMFYIKKEERAVGYLLPKDYCTVLVEYLRTKNVFGKDVMGYINPYARIYLPKAFSKETASKKIAIIVSLEKNKMRNSVRKILLIVSIVLFGGIFIATSYQNEKCTRAELRIIFADKMALILALDKDVKKIEDKLTGTEKELSKYLAENDKSNSLALLPVREKLLREINDLSQKRSELARQYNGEVRKVNNMMFYEMQRYVKKNIKLIRNK